LKGQSSVSRQPGIEFDPSYPIHRGRHCGPIAPVLFEEHAWLNQCISSGKTRSC
jgi:hypothetical protein